MWLKNARSRVALRPGSAVCEDARNTPGKTLPGVFSLTAPGGAARPRGMLWAFSGAPAYGGRGTEGMGTST